VSRRAGEKKGRGRGWYSKVNRKGAKISKNLAGDYLPHWVEWIHKPREQRSGSASTSVSVGGGKEEVESDSARRRGGRSHRSGVSTTRNRRHLIGPKIQDCLIRGPMRKPWQKEKKTRSGKKGEEVATGQAREILFLFVFFWCCVLFGGGVFVFVLFKRTIRKSIRRTFYEEGRARLGRISLSRTSGGLSNSSRCRDYCRLEGRGDNIGKQRIEERALSR